MSKHLSAQQVQYNRKRSKVTKYCVDKQIFCNFYRFTYNFLIYSNPPLEAQNKKSSNRIRLVISYAQMIFLIVIRNSHKALLPIYF